MSARRHAVVITTINVPRLLPAYLDDFARHGRDVEVIVIGDLNTPPEALPYCRSLAEGGSRVDYWDVDRQRAFLQRFPEVERLIPYRSIQRRNVGYLIAWESGADVIISMDDDNFLSDADYIGGHALVGTRATLPAVSAAGGWFNVGDFLATDTGRRFYHRGHPVSQRWKEGPITHGTQTARVAVNAGLWLGDADVDTTTRLEEPFKVVALAGESPHVALSPGTWAPFNSQSTAAIRDLLPFLYLIVAGSSLRGHRSDFRNFRYDDIWCSYFARTAMDRMGDVVSYGRPLVVQHRNPHNFLVDVDRELIPMFLTETLVSVLRRVQLTAGSYLELHGELLAGFRAELAREAGIDERERTFLGEVLDGMDVWGRACRTVMGG